MEYLDFFNEHWILTLEFIILFLLAMINELYISRNNKNLISINQVVDLINHQNAKIFDIRDPLAFASNHIKNSFNININKITSHNHVLQKYKKNNIIICSDGTDNLRKAFSILKEKDIEKLYIFKGGIQSWQNAGFPLVRTKKQLLNKQ